MKNSLIFRLRTGALILFSLCLNGSCSKDSLESVEELNIDLITAQKADKSLIEDHYIIILSTEPGKKDSKALTALENISGELSKMSEAKIKRKFEHSITGFTAKLSLKQVEKLKKDPRVLLIEQDSYVYPNGELSIQPYPDWGLDRIDQKYDPLDRAYSHTVTGSGVTAYLVDTGIRYSHKEFGGRASLGYDFVIEDEEEANNFDPSQEAGEDCYDHGTAVAAILGGAQSGVAKNVLLKSVRVWGCEGLSPRSRIIAAIDWITANAVQPAVVNMSGAAGDSLVGIAIRNSVETGLIYVSIAGNRNEEHCQSYPADLSGRLTVGASDIYNRRAETSNYGECVDIYAPGVGISSASNMDDVSFNKYSGTSYSSPFVAGVAALYLEVNPQALPDQTKTAIIANSIPDAISDVPVGAGNLLHSLWETVTFTPPPPPDLAFLATGEKVRSNYVASLTWNSTVSPYIDVYVDGAMVSTTPNDGEEQIILPKKGNNASYLLKICEVSYGSCSGEVILNFDEEPVTSPPSADFTFTANLLDVQFTDTSTDPDDSIVKWEWDFGDGSLSSEQNPLHSYGQAGTFTIFLTVSDNTGNIDSISKDITVSSEEPEPSPYRLSASGYKVKGEWHTDLSFVPSDSSQEIDIYRNDSFLVRVVNTGTYTDATNYKGGGSLTYQICDTGNTTSCSNEVIVEF